jgi:hypothetical protein
MNVLDHTPQYLPWFPLCDNPLHDRATDYSKPDCKKMATPFLKDIKTNLALSIWMLILWLASGFLIKL